MPGSFLVFSGNSPNNIYGSYIDGGGNIGL
jgi:hypothetical protein